MTKNSDFEKTSGTFFKRTHIHFQKNLNTERFQIFDYSSRLPRQTCYISVKNNFPLGREKVPILARTQLANIGSKKTREVAFLRGRFWFDILNMAQISKSSCFGAPILIEIVLFVITRAYSINFFAAGSVSFKAKITFIG